MLESILQAEVTWLLQAVNPDVPLNEAALGLIVEEVSIPSALAIFPSSNDCHMLMRWPPSLGGCAMSSLSCVRAIIAHLQSPRRARLFRCGLRFQLTSRSRA